MPYSQDQYDGSSYAGSYESYYAGSGQADPYYYYNYTSATSQYGYIYQHISFFDALGNYDHEIFEARDRYMSTTNQYTQSYQGGVYNRDIENTTTPLDGVYKSYGTRYTSTYDANYNTLSTDNVSFSDQQSYSIFSSVNYQTDATVVSYDTRDFYGAGFYEFNTTFYSGPGGYTAVSYGAYQYNSQG